MTAQRPLSESHPIFDKFLYESGIAIQTQAIEGVQSCTVDLVEHERQVVAAADRGYAAARSEIERLQKESDGWKADAERHAQNIDFWRSEVERLQKELEEVKSGQEGFKVGFSAGERHAMERVKEVIAQILSEDDTHPDDIALMSVLKEDLGLDKEGAK